MSDVINKIKLPNSWSWVKLKDISESIQYGYTESSSKEQIGPKFLRITDIQENRVKWDEVPYCKIDIENKNKYLLKDGDLVFARTGATVGKSFLIKGTIPEAIFASYLIRVRVSKEIDETFLSFFFNSNFYWSQITEGQVGIGQPNVNGSKLGQLNLPLPPKSIQQAIVVKIEELFSELDKGIENLRLAQQKLNLYRQTILNSLINRKNYQTIESVIQKLDQGWSPKCENKASIDNDEWAVIKTSAVQSGYFIENENKILPSQLKPKEQHEIVSGDVLVTRAGPRVRVGVCCVIKDIRPRLINCDKVYRIKVNNEIIIPEYFALIINTPLYQRKIEKMKSGISDSGLNLTQNAFLKMEIPIPTLKEQKSIVQIINNHLDASDCLELNITQSLSKAEAIRQSILKQAFEGSLI